MKVIPQPQDKAGSIDKTGIQRIMGKTTGRQVEKLKKKALLKKQKEVQEKECQQASKLGLQ